MLVEKKGSPGYDPKMYMAKENIQSILPAFFYKVPVHNVKIQCSYAGPTIKNDDLTITIQFNTTCVSSIL